MTTASESRSKDLLRVLESHRGFGWITCDWQPRAREGAPTAEELDEFVYRALGDENRQEYKGGYHELSVAEARHAIAHWMRHSLAYGPMLIGSGEVCDTTEPFFRTFAGAVRYFTNYKPLGSDAAMSAPKTLHTFDNGIVAVDAVNIGLIWFADED